MQPRATRSNCNLANDRKWVQEEVKQSMDDGTPVKIVMKRTRCSKNKIYRARKALLEGREVGKSGRPKMITKEDEVEIVEQVKKLAEKKSVLFNDVKRIVFIFLFFAIELFHHNHIIKKNLAGT